jgi:hypothetical protein
MNIKVLNKIFGYALFALGVIKILFTILILIQVGTIITAISSGENVAPENYVVFSWIIGFAQLILAFGSIIMIFLNINKKPGVITGYLLGLVALIIEIITPSILIIFIVFVQCGMYMRARTKIIKNNSITYQ